MKLILCYSLTIQDYKKRYDGNSGTVAFILKIVFELCSLNSANSRHFVFNEICQYSISVRKIIPKAG